YNSTVSGASKSGRPARENFGEFWAGSLTYRRPRFPRRIWADFLTYQGAQESWQRIRLAKNPEENRSKYGAIPNVSGTSTLRAPPGPVSNVSGTPLATTGHPALSRHT